MAVTTANTLKLSDVCLEIYGSTDTAGKSLAGCHAAANSGGFNASYDTLSSTKTLLDFRGYVHDTYPPEYPPLALRIPTMTTTTADLSWQAPDMSHGVTNQRVYWQVGSSGNWQWSGLIAAGAITYQVTGLTPDTPYNFYIRAYDAAGNVGLSNTVTASTLVAPYINVSPTSLSFTHTSAPSGSITVSANNAWNVSSKPSWITCSPSTAGGSTTMSVSASNNTGSLRSGTIILSSSGGTSASISVSQAAYVAPPSLTVSPTSMSFGSGGGTQYFSVTSNTTWSVSDNQSWISTSGASGSGNDSSIAVVVGSNEGAVIGGGSPGPTDPRSGTVTITGGGITRTISINQEGVAAPSYYTVQLYKGRQAEMCGAFPNGTYYTDNQTFSAATKLYTDSNGTTYAVAGFYSAGSYWRYWDGTAFTSTTYC